MRWSVGSASNSLSLGVTKSRSNKGVTKSTSDTSKKAFSTLADHHHSSDAARTSLIEDMSYHQRAHLEQILKSTAVHDHKVTVQAPRHDSNAKLMKDKSQDLARSVVSTESKDYWIMSGQGTLVFAIIIAANIFLIGVQADLPAKVSDFQNGTYVFWFAVDSVFNVVFLAEIVLRVRATGLAYWRQAANLFDVALVTLSVIDTWVVLLLANLGGISRVFRTLRLLRIFRILRLFRFCKTLWTLINTMLRALSALSWVMVLIVLFLYMVAVTVRLTLGVSMYEKLDGEALEVAEQRWGSVLQSMFTLFVCMTGEAWYDITLDAVAAEGWMYIVFVPFMCIANFLLVNLFIGIMCEKVSQEEVKNKQLSEQRADEETVHALAEIFVTIDEDGSDEITIEELSEALKNGRMEREFEGLHICMPTCITSLMRFFDNDRLEGDGFITFAEFVNGCMALRNSGLDVKMWFLQDELRQLSERLLAKVAGDDCQDRQKTATTADRGQNWMMEDVAQMLESRLREVKTGMMEDFTRILEAVVREATPAVKQEAHEAVIREATPAETHPAIAKQEAGPNPLAACAKQEPANLQTDEPDPSMARHVEFVPEPVAVSTQQDTTVVRRPSAYDAATEEITQSKTIKPKGRKTQAKVKKGNSKSVFVPSTGAADDAAPTEPASQDTSTHAAEVAAGMEPAPQIRSTQAAEIAAPMEPAPQITSTHAEDAAPTKPGPQITSSQAAEDAAVGYAKGSENLLMNALPEGLAAADVNQSHPDTQQGGTESKPFAAMAEQVLTDRPAQHSDPPNADQGRLVTPAFERDGCGGGSGDACTGTGETRPLDIELNFSTGPSED